MSKKRRQEVEEVRQAREDFLHESYWCMACKKVPAVDVHEIPRGVHRRTAYRTRKAWLALCRACHELMGDYSKWPLARQYALKKIEDPTHYDRRELNRLRERDPEAITVPEVLKEMAAIENERRS